MNIQNYIERKILSEENLTIIKNLISDCEWRDGVSSAFKMKHQIKKNFEIVEGELKSQISSIIMKSLDCDRKFIDFCIPKSSHECLISKTVKGGYYNPHRDYGLNGHFSTTIFISNPEDYGGGELCLYLDGVEKKFKPESGTAVTYKSGILHRVNEVSWGERIVCVLWTKTALRDDNIRNIYLNLQNVIKILDKNNTTQMFHKNFDYINEDPVFMLSELIEDIRRNYFE
jgi:PKHD-type hydroxylase